MNEYITLFGDGQQANYEIPVTEVLSDERFDWVMRRRECARIARLYEFSGDDKRALKCAGCGTSLSFGFDSAGKRKLTGANFCQQRLCPMCGARRARKNATALSKVMTRVEDECEGVRWLFLTLTIRNVGPDELRGALDAITTAWDRLCKLRRVRRAVLGWFRAIEITHNPRLDTAESYHPHLHAILAVDGKQYFDGPMYISHDDIMYMWRDALRVDYLPSVRIQVTRDKTGRSKGMSAAIEAAKYTTKSADIFGARTDAEAAEILTAYTWALRGKRLMAFGGLLRDAARALKVERMEQDKDLIHADEDAVREDVIVLMRDYRWCAALGEYICVAEYEPDEKHACFT